MTKEIEEFINNLNEKTLAATSLANMEHNYKTQMFYIMTLQQHPKRSTIQCFRSGEYTYNHVDVWGEHLFSFITPLLANNLETKAIAMAVQTSSFFPFVQKS